MAPTKREMAWLLAKKEKKEQEIVIVAVNVVSRSATPTTPQGNANVVEDALKTWKRAQT